MRRIKRKSKQAEAAPAPAATTAVATVDQGDLPAVPADLMELGRFQRPQNLKRLGGESVPWLAFHSAKSTRAGEVIQALGNVAEGTPYLCVEGSYYRADDVGFVSLEELPFWMTTAADFKPKKVWFEAQPFGATDGKDKIKEQCLSITLILPGAKPLHGDLAPALCTLTTWRSTKCPAIRGHLDAVEDTQDPKWAKANPTLAANLPPRFRVTSALRIETKSGGEFPYALAKAVPAPATVEQVNAIISWWQDEDCQEEFQAIQEAYDRQVAYLRGLPCGD